MRDEQLKREQAEHRERVRRELPHLSAYFQSGGFVDAVLNFGMPAPINVQVDVFCFSGVYTNLDLPVTVRASLSPAMTASDPVLQKVTRSFRENSHSS